MSSKDLLLQPFNKMQILIVDDDIIIRKSMKNALKNILKDIELDFELVEITDGNVLTDLCVNDISNNSIKMIFVDEEMGLTTGSEAIKKIRNLEDNEKLEKKFIVSVTSKADDDYVKEKIIRSGANKILMKPASISSIKSIIVDLFNN